MNPDVEWNIGRIIEKWALATPDKTAIIVDDKKASYAELNAEANRLAHVFLKLGLQKGDRIAALAYNSIESACTFVAAAKLGFVYVPLNNRLLTDELRYQLQNSGASAIVFDDSFAERLAPLADDIPLGKDHFLCMAESEELTPEPWYSLLVDWVEGCSDAEPVPTEPVYLNDPLSIIYTSGTTGAPKGAVVSHLQTYFKCFQVLLYADLREADRWLTMMPLFHSAGLFIALTPILSRGATLITSHSFDAARFVEMNTTHKPSILLATTTMWRFVLKNLEDTKPDFEHVRVCFGGGERTPLNLIENLQSLGLNLQMSFGQTENSFMALQDASDIIDTYGSVGRPGFFTDIWIQGSDGGKAADGDNGEIVARGPTVMSGYWEMPQKTAETIVDGVLHTGDIGYMDEHRHIYLVDREKDMYRSGAENVYPAEIEKLILQHPKVFDAAIIGVPDPDWGETGKAFIVPKQNQQIEGREILDFLDGKLARYKMPKHFEFLDALPMTETGKVKKVALKNLEQEQVKN